MATTDVGRKTRGNEGDGANRSAVLISDLIIGRDVRTEGMMPGWDIELAVQKTLFMTKPVDFPGLVSSVSSLLDAAYKTECCDTRRRCISYLLSIAESLGSPVELHHNLQSKALNGNSLLSDKDAASLRKSAVDMLLAWEKMDKAAVAAVLSGIKLEDIAINKGDNLFGTWGRNWQKDTGRDPYGSISDYLECFTKLYDPELYYPELYFAREEGKTNTQFFNDYGMQAARCRRTGSLGGTTNPAIAVMGENDLSGEGNIWGDEATAFIKSKTNKWNEIRKVIAAEQIKRNEADDWGATAFTEWVVVDAMLGLRSIFLLRGLGRVAFQLRPDWHMEEKKLTYAGGSIYAQLGKRVSVFDEILLEDVGEPYTAVAAARVGKANNHFKIACTSQVALNVVRAFNAGQHPVFSDAVKERMFTNVTLSYEVPQMMAASLATENGIKDYMERTGEKVDDGQGGSVVTSMIGRFNDAIRIYRIKALLAALPEGDARKESMNPSSYKTLEDPALTDPAFVKAVRDAGIDFDPAAEEDAIDHAASLLTKRTELILKSKYGLKRTRLLTASKRKFHQNTDLLDVPFSTDFGNIQAIYLKEMPLKIKNWKTITEDMNPDGTPKAGSDWAKRHEILGKIWPEWKAVWEEDGVKPEEYAGKIYVKPTLDQFIGFWTENVARAKKAREEAEKSN